MPTGIPSYQDHDPFSVVRNAVQDLHGNHPRAYLLGRRRVVGASPCCCVAALPRVLHGTARAVNPLIEFRALDVSAPSRQLVDIGEQLTVVSAHCRAPCRRAQPMRNELIMYAKVL